MGRFLGQGDNGGRAEWAAGVHGKYADERRAGQGAGSGQAEESFLTVSRCSRISVLADSNGANPTSDNGSPDSLGAAPLRL